MGSFVAAHSQLPDWKDAADECIAAVKEMGCEGSSLGLIYVTSTHGPYLSTIVQTLRSGTGIDDWVGAVAIGVIADGQELFDTPALSIMTCPLNEADYRVFDTVERDLDGFNVRHGKWCDEHSPYFGFVHGDPHNAALPALVEALSDRLGEGYLTGGLTSHDGSPNQVARSPMAGGLSGVLFEPNVTIRTRHTQGCTPLGLRHEITRCERNIIIELDNRPALDVFKEDIGELLARDIRRVAGYIFFGLPIAGNDTGDYLVRNLVGIDPRTGVLAIGDIPHEGQSVMFCRRDAASAVADLDRMLDELEQMSPSKPTGGVYFTCLARGPNLFGPNSEEMARIRARFPDVPILGFFANGEIAHRRIYAYTGVLSLFYDT